MSEACDGGDAPPPPGHTGGPGRRAARVLDAGHAATGEAETEEFVREALRPHSPAPFSLWRFTSADIELGGTRIPTRSPVLVDFQGVNTDPGRSTGPDLVFGAGPH
ncbi:cytochrome P450 [Actinorugispora endophytica]|uniref:Uncharacterized protein n=1 Tax=Actinorugispora endophytica TaxID=1605990 RepID=A0A4R6UG13_9ACTN|nr:cytochrome P450 [Actinorugispora endophytica]TDQ44189.1 hypothetical protein EV190_13726 [Actinorugispora endophytica]